MMTKELFVVPAERQTKAQPEGEFTHTRDDVPGVYFRNPVYDQHEYGKVFPKMSDAARATLTQDIGQNGQIDPVILFEGKILDGWHRYNACQWLGIECKFDVFEGSAEDAMDHILSLNWNRRHLSAGQRAIVAASVASLQPGRPKLEVVADEDGKKAKPKKEKKDKKVTQRDAAKTAGVSRRSVQVAAKVLKTAAPEVVEAVRDNRVTLEKARQISELPKEEQVQALAEPSKVKPAGKADKKKADAAPKAEKPAADVVPRADWDALVKERDDLKEKNQELADLLGTYEAVEKGSLQDQLNKELKVRRSVEAARDRLTNENSRLKREMAELNAKLKKAEGAKAKKDAAKF